MICNYFKFLFYWGQQKLRENLEKIKTVGLLSETQPHACVCVLTDPYPI